MQSHPLFVQWFLRLCRTKDRDTHMPQAQDQRGLIQVANGLVFWDVNGGVNVRAFAPVVGASN